MASSENNNADLAAIQRRFQDEGRLEIANGNAPFLLDDPESVWIVESGRIEVFTVSVLDGKSDGARSHFVTVDPGHCMFGMDLERYGMGSGFLAVGRMGTKLRRLSVARLEELASDEEFTRGIALLVDAWVFDLSKTLTKDIIPAPLADVSLVDEQEASLASQEKARSKKGTVWVDVLAGNLLYISMEELAFFGERRFFPLSSESWVEAANEPDVSTDLKAFTSIEVVHERSFWAGLAYFHEVLCQCEFINKRLSTVDEFNRLKSKAEYAMAAKRAAFRDLASVLDMSVKKDLVSDDARADPFFHACVMVGEELGIDVKDHPEGSENHGFEIRLAMIAKSSRFRTRQVALRDDWWNYDHGPLFGRLEDSEEAIALLPTSSTSYEAVDPKSGTRVPVTEEVGERLASFASVFYRPFPDGVMTLKRLVRFAGHGLAKDLGLMLLMGGAVGALAALTPIFTGKIFDAAIPEAERGLLLQYTLALLIAALTSAAFELTQSVTVLRIQGKVDYTLQASLWDRLLNLPSTFFRKFSSGDLADRASGVNKIRDIIAGAGIEAILGMITSLFFLAVMFKYNKTLCFVAIGMVLTLVIFTTSMNLIQLRFQRDQLERRGAIAGMVLQLIGGVAKLRISGAEDHALRVWAEKFAKMRRVSFVIGRIQNAVQVFNSSFTLFSSIAVFATLVAVQKKAAESGGGAPPLTTGEFIGFNSAYMSFAGAMQKLSGASLGMLQIVPIYERFQPILLEEAEIDEAKAYPGKLTGSIEVSHAHFKYIEDQPWVLKDISLKIEPGEFIAFVGGSGSGKSTLMRLLLGFEVPQKGSVYFDGQDLSSLDVREVRQQMGVVLQSSELLPADIFRNIVGTSALTVEDAWEAARLVALDEDVRQMPMGMHTYVPEGGGGFSGGQQQRMLLARSIVHRPRILFLDEATSALDNRTQAIVTKSMEQLQATRIAIAHRLSTIINADRICYLDKGEIAEIGSYEELMKLDGLFAELARRQVA